MESLQEKILTKYLEGRIVIPLYVFKDTETDEIFEEIMSFSSREKFLKDNPNIVAVITPVAFVSGIAGVTHKVEGGFKDVLSRIADANPHTPLGHEYGRKGIKESKTREVVKRHRSNQSKS